MIQINETEYAQTRAISSETIRTQIEADIISYGCEVEVIDEVCEKALNNEYIDILDILEDTDLVDMYQAAELVKTWFGESAVFTSYHIFLSEVRKREVRIGLKKLGILNKDLDVFEYLRKAEVKKLFAFIQRHVILKDVEAVKDMIVSWTGDINYRPTSW